MELSEHPEHKLSQRNITPKNMQVTSWVISYANKQS